jgi:predicted dehydrogenase
MMEKPVSCAVVGLGRWGQTLVTSMADCEDPQLRFVRAVTRTPDNARAFCDTHDLHLSDDFDAVLNDPAVEAVVIATPHSQHDTQVLAALAAGKHVFVEKPLALEQHAAEQMVKAAHTANLCLAVGFNRRFLPAFQKLQTCISNGTIGKPLLAEGQFSGPWGYTYAADMWRGQKTENPAGGMAAMGIHVLDAMIALLGPVLSVQTLSKSQELTTGLHDTTVTMIDFTSGAIGTLSTVMVTPTYWRLHVAGTKGWVTMPDQNSIITYDANGHYQSQTFAPRDSIAAELRAFGQAIRKSAPYPIPVDEIISGVAAMEAISASAERNGQKIEVNKEQFST